MVSPWKKKDNAKLVVINILYTPASTFTYPEQAWFDEFLKKAKDEAAEWLTKLKKMSPKMEWK